MEEHPPVGGDTAWVKYILIKTDLQLYTDRSPPGLPIRTLRCTKRRDEAIRRRSPRGAYVQISVYVLINSHPVKYCTTKLTGEDDTILDLWGVGPNRPPIDTHHPAVRTHPVTGLKALNVNTGFVTGFAELNKTESGFSS